MYANTTWVQVARAVAVWTTGFGVALLTFVAPDLVTRTDLTGLALAIGLVVVGVSTIMWARWRLAGLDAFNRPFLLSEAGVTIMAPRQRFLDAVTKVKRRLLAMFLAFGTLFIFLVSAASCDGTTQGFCDYVTQPADGIIAFVQMAALVTGLLYLGCVVLSRTHDAETERLDVVIAEGQRRRRDDGPLAGARSRGWE